MPELPEVQMTVNELCDTIIGKTIEHVWTDYASDFYAGKQQIKNPDYFSYFSQTVQGAVITDVSRRAKEIWIHLNNDMVIIVHMKMTGHFLYGTYVWNKKTHTWQPPSGYWDKSWSMTIEEVRRTMPFSDPYNNFIHFLITFGDSTQLAFSDMRKFATIRLVSLNGSSKHTYGPDALDLQLTWQEFAKHYMRHPRMKIKTALLNQHIVAGFGNIYSDETLFQSGIHPASVVGSIPDSQWKKLFTQGRRILNIALQHGGDSIGDYRRVDGRGGSFQNMHRVYQQEGRHCSRCKAIIIKEKINQRISRLCPNCQVLYT